MTMLVRSVGGVSQDEPRASGTPGLLMCRPDYYGIEYEINPWMDKRRAAVHSEAVGQWESLATLLRGLGARIELIEPAPGLPDMVFTANAGLVQHDLFVGSRFRPLERRPESDHFDRWFADRGWRVLGLATPKAFEGAGDVLFCGDALFAGYKHRSDIGTHQHLGRLLGCQVLSLELVDPRFYHLDTCFCPLRPGCALCHRPALDEYACRVLAESIPDLIEVDEADAAQFACNAVVLGQHVVLNACGEGLVRQLGERGFTVHQTPLSEYIKAGGAAKCLTLRLDGEEAAGWKRTRPRSSARHVSDL